jgi:hypothetical protein
VNVVPPHTTTKSVEMATPTAIAEVGAELKPGSLEVWQPASFKEWEGRERTRAFLAAWSQQMSHERELRSLSAKCIFALITAQTAAAFSIVVAQGAGALIIDVNVLRILIPSVMAEVLGLGYLVVKYLFSQPLRHGLDSLITGARKNGP